MKSRYIAYFLLILVAVSCEPKIDDFTPKPGTADFSRYVSLGNSLTAGYADGALYTSGQSYSYASLIAGQLVLVGGSNFIQPVVTNEDGLLSGKLKLGISANCLGVSGLGPVSAGGTPTGIPNALAPVGYTVNNFGVPGAKSYHLIAPGYGNPDGLQADPKTANPYFVRFASSATTSVLADAVAANATFFSLWIGNNDVLGYATSGGALVNDITSQDLFAFAVNGIVEAMTANGAKGFIANIPDVTSVPFFTTIPYNGLILTEQAQVDALNQIYGNYSPAITFTLGQNPFIISDPTSPNGHGKRQLAPGELVLLTLPQDSIRCAGWGSLNPIPGQYILDASEVAAVKSATQGYNQTLADLATAKGLAFADADSFMAKAKSGLVYDGLRFSVSFVTGGIFSLDGVHLSPRGNAIIANYFIDAVNGQYGSTVPHVNVGDYPGIMFP